MDAARAAMGQGWPFAACPWNGDGANEPGAKRRAGCRGKRFWLLFPRLEKVTRPAGRNQCVNHPHKKAAARTQKKQPAKLQLAQPTRHLHHPLPHRPNRPNRLIIMTASGICEMNGLPSISGPNGCISRPAPHPSSINCRFISATQCAPMAAEMAWISSEKTSPALTSGPGTLNKGDRLLRGPLCRSFTSPPSSPPKPRRH